MQRKLLFNGIIFDNGEKGYLFNNFNPNDGINVSRDEKQLAGTDNMSIAVNARYEPRVVNLKGVILADNRQRLYEKIRFLTTRCNGKTDDYLYYDNGYNVFRSRAVADVPSFGEYMGVSPCGCEYNINFTLLNFFWEDNSETETEITGSGTSYILAANSPCAVYPKLYITPNADPKTLTVKWATSYITGLDTVILSADFSSYTLAAGKYICIDFGTGALTYETGAILTKAITAIRRFELPTETSRIIEISGVVPSKVILKYRKNYIGV